MEARMGIDRRKLLLAAVCSALTGPVGATGAGQALVEPQRPGADEWHPLTRSLLERARRIGRDPSPPDRALTERAIGRFADAAGYNSELVIKWMDTPRDAFDHLCGFGLETLLDMGSASFWRRVQPPAPRDIETFDRAFEALMLANELLAVHECDRTLMAPKLLAKSLARSSNSSDCEVFRVRSVCSQIGWLETSSAEVAAQAVSNVDLLLSAGASESSVAIDHQLTVFEVNECGLLATWETADALVCVPRSRI
jgi:hypothetical protein